MCFVRMKNSEKCGISEKVHNFLKAYTLIERGLFDLHAPSDTVVDEMKNTTTQQSNHTTKQKHDDKANLRRRVFRTKRRLDDNIRV